MTSTNLERRLCPKSEAELPETKPRQYILMNLIGQVLEQKGIPAREDRSVTVYVVGDAPLLEQIRVRRTSATRDPNQFRLGGTDSTLLDAQSLECETVEHVLTGFDAGEGKITLEAADSGDGNKIKTIAEVTFPVLALFHGAVSFGPMVAFDGNNSYRVVADTSGARRLRKTGNGRELDYAITLTYFPFGPRLRNGGAGLGLSLSIPITDGFGESAYASVTADLGQAVMVHGGIRYGKETRPIASQIDLLDEAVLDSDFTLEQETVWTPSFAMGIAVDLGLATRAFGDLIKTTR